MKKEKGITLVALIITIVVLLILATVSIQTLTGNNGLLIKTETAVQSNKDSQEEEKIKLAVVAAQLAGEGTLTDDNLLNELKRNLGNNGIFFKQTSLGWNYRKDNNYRIYKDGKVEKTLLPAEYQQVEYIESTGTQWIDTEYMPKTNTELNLEVSFSGGFSGSQSGNTTIFGARNEDGLYVFCLNFGGNYNEGNTLYAWINKDFGKGGTICSVNINDDIRTNRNLIKMKSESITYGTVSRILDVKTQDNDNSLILFADSSKKPFSAYNMKVYSLKMYEGNELKRNYIPCYYIQNEKFGLYEELEGKFYTNQGLGEFTAGLDV